MSDSQFETIEKLLNEISHNTTGIVCLLGFSFIMLCLIGALIFCHYYDKELVRKKKNFEDDVRRIFLEESKRNESH